MKQSGHVARYALLLGSRPLGKSLHGLLRGRIHAVSVFVDCQSIQGTATNIGNRKKIGGYNAYSNPCMSIIVSIVEDDRLIYLYYSIV